MPAPRSDMVEVVAGVAQDLGAAVIVLKQERDTWRAVAEKYQEAFEAQTARLRELQDICFATQAELENERTTPRRTRTSGLSQESLRSEAQRSTADIDDKPENCSFRTATSCESSRAEVPLPPNFCFRRVEHFTEQRQYGTALTELEHLLRGPLAPQTRVEGLLLKSNVMRKSEWLYDALAACSEARELCSRLEELHSYLPKIQYQRGICYYQLRMMKQARDAFSDACADDDPLYAKATDMRDLCVEQLQGRRSAFEAHRTVTQGLLAQLHDNRTESKRHRASQQLRYHAAKARRLSLPQRWMGPKTTSSRTN